mmetsp:Transcript_28693/g.66572  ORF Transcript_28693/g.66572 Transcript_28693/m.66572 type:complete len:169 (-) Transcript_28693:177-683(-)|eukprot:CAMPEP_0178413702 /NCGR_PEP_ID=MMETSP0689_2-20121128/22663_1 /TAXON_ID=160604 /ORGANISM="Amphidinium massartii, Strain CS-259" /LENGTH=168 /DNA_ID=CAMNT_0020034981 /DNA_START=86 /DNA_END=592 /DNA_ORIENTATION=+
MGGVCSLSAAGMRCALPRISEEDAERQQRTLALLMEAVRSGKLGQTQRCLLEGASPDAFDEHGWAPLHYSASAGHLELCRLLLDFDADVNSALPDLSTPLMLAADEGHMPVARLLLERGAITSCKDEDGFTVTGRCDPQAQTELQSLIGALACDVSSHTVLHAKEVVL